MLENENKQFHLDPSPKKQAKNEESRKKDQNFSIIFQKKVSNSSVQPKMENTLLIYVNRAKKWCL